VHVTIKDDEGVRDLDEDVSYSGKTLLESFLLEVLKENQTDSKYRNK
jgi:hypothetical protein